MLLQESSFNKYIIASVILHLGLIASTTLFKTKDTRPIEVEISFGSGNSRGGSGPKAIVPKIEAAPKTVKKVAPVAPQSPRVKTDAPVVAQEEQKQVPPSTPTSVAATSTETGSGLGTTSGSGSGTTSGSGAGFNDPKIKYRGLIYQLVNSKKVYPRKARALQQEGTVVAKIKLSKDGKLLKVEIVKSSSYKILSEATLDAIKGIKKFPEIPSELGLEEITFNIPFEYEIRTGDTI